MKNLILPALALVAVSCSQAQFGRNDGKKAEGGVVLPATGQLNPEKGPLDLGGQDLNKTQFPDGPRGGDGKVLDKVIELGCENATGIIVDLGGGGGTGSGSDGGKNPGKLKLTSESGLRLLGKDTEIDTDGKPIGKPDGTGSETKPGGEEPIPEFPPIDVPTESRVVTKIRGQFCPEASNKLTVLFVVDFSGSMGRHVPGMGLPEVPGNDPQIDGSCGRLRSAQAILAKIEAEKKPGDVVEIGMVPFAGGIVTDKIVKIADLATFKAQVSKDSFCQYVVQDASFGYDPGNPGGIDGPAGFLGFGKVDSSTNYTAAFTAAESLLTGVYGRKVSYFISDGEPTSGGADPVQAGIAAGNRMRQVVDNLTLNAILLGQMAPSAQQVLEQVTGSPDRVRKVELADELAKEIVLFPAASIDDSSAKATLAVEPYPRADLGLHFFGPHPTQAAIWIWETQPFVLQGKPGVSTLNLVEVTARGADGTTYKSEIRIRYTP